MEGMEPIMDDVVDQLFPSYALPHPTHAHSHPPFFPQQQHPPSHLYNFYQRNPSAVPSPSPSPSVPPAPPPHPDAAPTPAPAPATAPDPPSAAITAHRRPSTDDGPIDDEPLYVNAKQYYRILKRRVARARLEEVHRLSRQRKVRPVPPPSKK